MTDNVARTLASDSCLLEMVVEARLAFEGHDFAGAARLSFQVLERQPSYLPALLLFARTVQLADEPSTPEYSIEHVRTALKKAADVQSECGDAEHEFARFLFAVEDQDAAALELLDGAITARMNQLRDLLLARIEVLQDMGDQPTTQKRLKEAKDMFPDEQAFRESGS